MSYNLVEGKSYGMPLQVTNLSTRGGVPVGVTMTFAVKGTTPNRQIVDWRKTVTMAAGGVFTEEILINVPAGSADEEGVFTVEAIAPTGVKIAEASEIFIIMAWVFGRVYDMVTSAPLAGVSVVVDGSLKSTTGASGDYVLELPQGVYQVAFLKDGYEPTIYGRLEFKEGALNNNRNVGLMPSPTANANLTGVITDNWGLVVPGVKVTLTAYRATPEGGTVQVYYEALTNASGVYSFSGVLTMTYSLSLIKNGYEAKAVSVSLSPGNNQRNEIIVPMSPTAIQLYFTNPKYGATVWNIRVIDPVTGQSLRITPSGIKEPQIPCVFAPSGTTFLLYVMEQLWGGPAYWLGPYVVTVPGFGSYTWNSKNGTISGGTAIDLTKNSNSIVIGTVQAISAEPADDEAGTQKWSSITILIEDSQDISGYTNSAEWFIGTLVTIKDPQMPMYPGFSPVIEVGERVICQMRLKWDLARGGAYWEASSFEYPLEYPASAYQFSGSLLMTRRYYENVWMYDFAYAVTGNVSPFRVVIVKESYAIYTNKLDTLGPISGSLVRQFGAGRLRLFAHPNPNKVFNWYKQNLDHWQLVGSYYMPY